MGWLFGWDSRRSLVSHLLDPKHWGSGIEARAIAHQSAGYTNLWVVWELNYSKDYGQTEANERYREYMLPKAGQTRRFIALYLLKGGWKNAEWGYKDLEESCGPCEVNCPLSYLDLVPDPGGHATEWRKRVREYWATKREQRAGVQSLQIGQRVVLKPGWKALGDSVKEARITSLKPFRVALGYYGNCKLPMKAIDFEATEQLALDERRDALEIDAAAPQTVEPVTEILNLF